MSDPKKSGQRGPAKKKPVPQVQGTAPEATATPLRGMTQAVAFVDDAPFVPTPEALAPATAMETADAAAVADADDGEEGTIYGSETLPPMVMFGGVEVTLGEAVIAAFEKSGMSEVAWNELTDEARTKLIEEVLDPKEPAEDTIEAFLKQKFPRMNGIPGKVMEVITGMQHYVEHMNPARPTDMKTGQQQQRGLLYLFFTALSQDGSISKVCIEVILWFFRKYSGEALGPLTVYRFMSVNRMTPGELDCLRGLLNLFLATAKPETRREAVKKNISMRRISESLSNDRQRENLLNFYS